MEEYCFQTVQQRKEKNSPLGMVYAPTRSQRVEKNQMTCNAFQF